LSSGTKNTGCFLWASQWKRIRRKVAMEVSPQQISKIVSGKENLTIETQIKLQEILSIPILASYYENK